MAWMRRVFGRGGIPLTTETAVGGVARRHDLDALRAFAMLLGIALHASMSFVPAAWMVQDSRPNMGFGLFLAVIHGFRMPLFFLVSGFFTAMLLRRRGVRGLLRQRALRILLPLVVGVLTIVPLQHAVSSWAIRTAGKRAIADSGTLVDAIRRGDAPAVRARLEAGANANAVDATMGVTPLAWAVMLGDAETAALLLDRGADVNGRNVDGNTPLHGAAFLGRVAMVDLLLEKGADVLSRGGDGSLPVSSTRVDADTTYLLAQVLGIKVGAREDLARRRAEVRKRLEPRMGALPEKEASAKQTPGDLRQTYGRFLSSEAFRVHVGGKSIQLFQTLLLDHLWFLWFLCWLAPLYVVGEWAVSRLGMGRLIPLRWAMLGLVPLTLIPQWFMGITAPSFGADTSSGLLPLPHVLLYYGLFFVFGAMDYDAGDVAGKVSRRGWVWFSMALFLALPVGLANMVGGNRALGVVAQVGYAWAMSLGLMGVFRRKVSRENRAIRYVSDASYFLYLAHLPLVIVAQTWVRDWPLPSSLKFLLILTGVTALLLIVYETVIRYSVIGRILNGPRARVSRVPLSREPASV